MASIKKNQIAKDAVNKNQILKKVLYLKFFNLIKYQVTNNAINKSIGFIKFDQSGVLAANNTSALSNQIIKTKASGQFVIKPVIFHNHFTHFKADRINSILNQTKNISTIIPLAQINDSFICHHIIKADHKKNKRVIHQIVKSNFWIDSKISFFIILIIKLK